MFLKSRYSVPVCGTKEAIRTARVRTASIHADAGCDPDCAREIAAAAQRLTAKAQPHSRIMNRKGSRIGLERAWNALNKCDHNTLPKTSRQSPTPQFLNFCLFGMTSRTTPLKNTRVRHPSSLRLCVFASVPPCLCGVLKPDRAGGRLRLAAREAKPQQGVCAGASWAALALSRLVSAGATSASRPKIITVSPLSPRPEDRSVAPSLRRRPRSAARHWRKRIFRRSAPS